MEAGRSSTETTKAKPTSYSAKMITSNGKNTVIHDRRI